MKFTKMHGLGNDYVFVNCLEQRVSNAPSLARAVSDRHCGVGSDGLILICPCDHADVRMEVFNADGSRAEMCGNGLRCVAKFAVEHGLVAGPHVAIDTDAGIRKAECDMVDGIVRDVRVDMGRPSLSPVDLPATIRADRLVGHPLLVSDETYTVTCVSMGNPHAVVFVDDLSEVDLRVAGPRIERASIFPKRINVHFVRVDMPNHVTMVTWERGSGVTRACGSGACAVGVAGAMTGRTRRTITATLPGGDLHIDWTDDDHVYMTGPAVEVFSGEWFPVG